MGKSFDEGQLNEIDTQRRDSIIRLSEHEENEINTNSIRLMEPELMGLQTSPNEQYYERILQHSSDRNMALKLKVGAKLKSSEWATTRKEPFVQKLPAARRTIKERRRENAAIDEAKKTFRNADKCTVREKAAMEQYFGSWKEGKDPGYAGGNKADDPELREYVDSILGMELNVTKLTDDYMSDHMPELYEYARKLRHYESMKKKYPEFFRALTDDEKAMLETKTACSAALQELLSSHMHLHGIEIKEGADGKISMKLSKESRDKERRHAKRRELKAAYDAKLDAFVKNHIYDPEMRLARTYTTREAFQADKAAQELEQRLESRAEAKRLCGREIETAMTELKKSWAVRDSLIGKQRELLAEYDNETDEKKKKKLEARIARNNSRIRVTNLHGQHYRDFIDFATGSRNAVTAATAKYLETEGQTALLRLVHIKSMADCMESGIIGAEKMRLRAKAKQLHMEAVNGDAEGAVMNEELEEKSRLNTEAADALDFNGADTDTFYKKVEKYRSASEKKKRFGKFAKGGEKNTRTALGNLENYMKDQVKEHGVIRADAGEDADEDVSLASILEAPLTKVEKREIRYGDTMTKEEALTLFACYKPAADAEEMHGHINMSQPARRAGMDLVYEITELTKAPEKLAALKCPAHPDLESTGFWHNRSLVRLGKNRKLLFDALKNWDIPLKAEMKARIVAFGRMAELLAKDYDIFEKQLADPMSAVAQDERITGSALADMNRKVFPEGGAEDAEVKGRLREYDKINASMQFKPEGKEEIGKISVFEAVSGYLADRVRLEKPQGAPGEEQPDPLKVFEDEYRKVLRREQENENRLSALEQVQVSTTWDRYEEDLNQEKQEKERAEARAREEAERQRIEKEEEEKRRIEAEKKQAEEEQKRKEREAMLEEKRRRDALYAKFVKAEVKNYHDAGKARYLKKISTNTQTKAEAEAWEQSQFDRQTLNAELKRMQQYYPEAGEDEARTRLMVRNMQRSSSMVMTDEMRDRWKKNYEYDPEKGKVGEGYKWLIRPVIYASDGSLTKEGQENLEYNRSVAEDYISGDLKRRKKALTAIGKELASIEVTEDMLDIYYMEANPTEMCRICELVHGAQDILKEYPDFFAGDAFTAEERRNLMFNLTETGLLFNLVSSYEEFLKTFGADVNEADGELKQPEAKDEEEKRDKIDKSRAEAAEKYSRIFNSESDFGVARAAAKRKDFMEKAEKLIVKNAAKEKTDEKKAVPGTEAKDENAGYDEEYRRILNVRNKADRERQIAEYNERKRVDKLRMELSALEEKLNLPPLPKYKTISGLAGDDDYEAGESGNCWCCSGAALFNKFEELHSGKAKSSLDQYDVREYDPIKSGKIRTWEEIEEYNRTCVKKEDMITKEEYEKAVNDASAYMGKNKKERGDLFGTADFFMEKRRDLAMNRMRIKLPGLDGEEGRPKSAGEKEKDAILYHSQKAAFINKVKEVLGTGNVVAFLNHSKGHYVTITELRGEEIKYMNSEFGQEPENIRSVDEMLQLESGGSTVELTWMSKLKKPEDMVKENPGLEYDEKEGYSSKQTTREAMLNVACKDGVLAAGGSGTDGIELSVYVPKHPEAV